MSTTSTSSNNEMSYRGGRGFQQQQKSKCKFCGGAIKWVDDPTGATRDDGSPKRVPLNAYPPFERHRCSSFQKQAQNYRNMSNKQKSEGVDCRFGCGQKITFSADQKTDRGKFIPLNMVDLTPHQCPNKPQYNNQSNSSRNFGDKGFTSSTTTTDKDGDLEEF